MKILADLHNHTVASGHAYSTIEEMISRAKKNKVKILGISDHAPGLLGGANIFHFGNLYVVPRYIEGIILLKGVEANIMDFEGNIDMPARILKRLDFAIASLHPPCIDPGTKEENTNAILGVMKNGHVNIIGHPDDSRYPLDYDTIVRASKLYNVALEINNASLRPDSYRQGVHENAKTILNLCKKYEVKVIFGSDSHISYDIGNFSNCIRIAEEVNFPNELIINYSRDAINDLLEEQIL